MTIVGTPQTKMKVKNIYKDEKTKEIKDIILNSYILFVRKAVVKY